MAAQAAQVVLAVCRARKVRVIFARAVALEAAFVYHVRGGAFEAKYLRFVPAALDVLLARTMATFTTLLG
jgi:hypothetical protein